MVKFPTLKAVSLSPFLKRRLDMCRQRLAIIACNTTTGVLGTNSYFHLQ